MTGRPAIVPRSLVLAISVGAVAAGGGARGDEPVASRPLSLGEAVTIALERNPAIDTAGEELRKAQALVVQARAASMPSLVGTASYQRLDAARELKGNVLSPRDAVNGIVTATVPLVNPRGWAQWSHARDDVAGAGASAEDTRRVVAVAVARAYLGVITQKHLLEALRRARDTAAAHLAFTRTRAKAGLGSELDETRAALELAADEAVFRGSFAGLTRAREALGVLVGIAEPVDTAEEFHLPDAPALSEALAELGERRRDLAALEARLTAARHAARDGWTDYAPNLSATGLAFAQDPPTPQLPSRGWQVLLSLSFPLFDGGMRSGVSAEREVRVGEAQVAFDALQRQARADTRAAYEAVERADAALEAATDASRFAARALSLADQSYRAGRSSNLDVIDAEHQALSAETGVALATDAAHQARLDALAASGRFPSGGKEGP